jgi:hypothetical protein
MPPAINITGQRFGRLVAIARVEGRQWRWKCDCGNEIVQVAGIVKSGNSKSCGCFNLDSLRRRMTKHGMSKHPLYSLWSGMRARCANHPNYAGRGIKVCERWNDFSAFVADMGPRPQGTSLERKRVNEGYNPDNCIWATRRDQAENTRRNVFLELDGEKLTVSQWSRKLGISQKTLNRRRSNGWSDSEILTIPLGERRQ